MISVRSAMASGMNASELIEVAHSNKYLEFSAREFVIRPQNQTASGTWREIEIVEPMSVMTIMDSEARDN